MNILFLLQEINLKINNQMPFLLSHKTLGEVNYVLETPKGALGTLNDALRSPKDILGELTIALGTPKDILGEYISALELQPICWGKQLECWGFHQNLIN